MCYKLHLLSDNACVNSHALIPPTTKTQAQRTDTRAPFKSDDLNRTNEVGARNVLHYHRLQSRKRITCCLGLGWMTPLMRSRRVNGCLRGLCTLKAPVSVIRFVMFSSLVRRSKNWWLSLKT